MASSSDIQNEELLPAGTSSEPVRSDCCSPLPPKNPVQRRILSLRKVYFIFATLAYSLNGITLLRLPYIYSKHGTAMFIALPLCTLLITCPLLCCELFIGQLVWSQSYLALPKLHPAMCGLGLSAFILMIYVTIYSSAPIAWSLALSWHSLCNLFTFPSFLLPSAQIMPKPENDTAWMESDWSAPWVRRVDGGVEGGSLTLFTSQAVDFFYKNVLTAVAKIDAMNSIRHYFVCEVLTAMVLFWILVFILLLLKRHVHTLVTIVIVKFLVIFIVSLLLSIFLSPSEQNSFVNGMKLLFRFNTGTFESLLSPQLWIDSACQSLLSVGAMTGFVWVNAAHLRLRNDFKRDAIALSIHQLVASLLSLLFCFAGIGAYENVTEINNFGPAFPFVAILGLFSNWTRNRYVIGLLPVLFFILVALVQACCHVFNILAAVNVLCHSRLPSLLSNNGFASFIICLFLLLFSHPFTTSTGIYLLQGLDTYVLPFVVVAIASAQLFLFSWIYSWPRIKIATTRALKHEPCYLWSIMWRFVAPFLSVFILGAGVVARILQNYGYIAYRDKDIGKSNAGQLVTEAYPRQMMWMDAVLIALALLPIIVLPLLRKCGLVIFPYAPLRHELDKTGSADDGMPRSRSASGQSHPLFSHCNFPYIDASIEEIIAWELAQREQIMYETLHQNGRCKSTSSSPKDNNNRSRSSSRGQQKSLLA